MAEQTPILSDQQPAVIVAAEPEPPEEEATESVASPAKVLRIAQAQLVGWLEGVFHGIQTALFAQQMAARAQLEEMRRRALPAGTTDQGQPEVRHGGGQYL